MYLFSWLKLQISKCIFFMAETALRISKWMRYFLVVRSVVNGIKLKYLKLFLPSSSSAIAVPSLGVSHPDSSRSTTSAGCHLLKHR